MNDRCAAVASNLAELRWSQGYVHIFFAGGGRVGRSFFNTFQKVKTAHKT